MIRFSLIIAIYFFSPLCQGQVFNKVFNSSVAINSQWTWIKGDDVSNQLGVYGTQGIPAAGNKPGARWNCYSWTDAIGNLWLFGGEGYASSSSLGLLNDLWKFDVSLQQWAWMKGDNTTNVSAVYGTRGVAAAANKPGARQNGVAWVDNLGRFWLFGGTAFTNFNVGIVNDLWTYNLATNQWMWVAGNNFTDGSLVVGEKEEFGPTFTPGSRAGSTSWSVGNLLYLFGGRGLGQSFGPGYLADLWKFDVSLQQWAWVRGPLTLNNSGIYRTRGAVNDTTEPGARVEAFGWVDANNDLVLFAGQGYCKPCPFGTCSVGLLDDVWKYNSLSKRWTYVAGSDTINTNPPNYGGAGSNPGGRLAGISWSDADGDGWIFGGIRNSGRYNDLWRYTASTNQWDWIKGDNAQNVNGIYGTPGVSSGHNKPGSRYNAVSWKEGANFWLFGGAGEASTNSGLLNDLWKIGKGVTTFSFIGNGDWNDPNNWSNNTVPSSTIADGMEVIINHSVGGQCTLTGNIIIQPGGILKVLNSKTFNVKPL